MEFLVALYSIVVLLGRRGGYFFKVHIPDPITAQSPHLIA